MSSSQDTTNPSRRGLLARIPAAALATTSLSSAAVAAGASSLQVLCSFATERHRLLHEMMEDDFSGPDWSPVAAECCQLRADIARHAVLTAEDFWAKAEFVFELVGGSSAILDQVTDEGELREHNATSDALQKLILCDLMAVRHKL